MGKEKLLRQIREMGFEPIEWTVRITWYFARGVISAYGLPVDFEGEKPDRKEDLLPLLDEKVGP